MDWIRDYTSSDTHPQIVKAGFWGALVFRTLCRLSGAHRLNGRVGPRFADPEFLHGHLRCGEDVPVDRIELGIRKAIAAGLLKRDDSDASLIIDGWQRVYSDPTHADRQRKYRERQSTALAVVYDDSDASPQHIGQRPNEMLSDALRDEVTQKERKKERKKDLESKPLSADADPPVLPLGDSSADFEPPPAGDPPDLAAVTFSESGAPLGGTPVTRVFAYWRRMMQHPQAKLDQKRRRLIEHALKRLKYTEEQLATAVTGCWRSPWHQGQNEDHRRYDDIELILRDAKHVDQFIALASKSRPADPKRGDVNAAFPAETGT